MDIDGLAYAEQRVAERRAGVIQRRARRKRERAQLAVRRTAGLRSRHARKTR